MPSSPSAKIKSSNSATSSSPRSLPPSSPTATHIVTGPIALPPCLLGTPAALHARPSSTHLSPTASPQKDSNTEQQERLRYFSDASTVLFLQDDSDSSLEQMLDSRRNSAEKEANVAAANLFSQDWVKITCEAIKLIWLPPVISPKKENLTFHLTAQCDFQILLETDRLSREEKQLLTIKFPITVNLAQICCSAKSFSAQDCSYQIRHTPLQAEENKTELTAIAQGRLIIFEKQQRGWVLHGCTAHQAYAVITLQKQDAQIVTRFCGEMVSLEIINPGSETHRQLSYIARSHSCSTPEFTCTVENSTTLQELLFGNPNPDSSCRVSTSRFSLFANKPKDQPPAGLLPTLFRTHCAKIDNLLTAKGVTLPERKQVIDFASWHSQLMQVLAIHLPEPPTSLEAGIHQVLATQQTQKASEWLEMYCQQRLSDRRLNLR